jgi:hypothetical protein
MGIRCANDAPDRDPDVVVLEGSNDKEFTSYASGTWTPITTISNIAVGFTVRWKSQEFLFPNATEYRNVAGAWATHHSQPLLYAGRRSLADWIGFIEPGRASRGCGIEALGGLLATEELSPIHRCNQI